MPQMNTADVTAISNLFKEIAPSFELAMSEALNQQVVIEQTSVTLEPIDGLVMDPTPVLQTTYSFPGISQDEALLAFQGRDAMILADLAGGGDGSTAPLTLLDEHNYLLAEATKKMVGGLGAALGNATNRNIQAGPCATAFEQIVVPPAFAAIEEAVQITYDFSVPGLLESSVRLIFTPDLCRTLAPAQATAAPPALPMLPPDAGVPPLDLWGAQGSAPTAPGGFPPLPAHSSGHEGMPRGLELILDIPLEVTVELGRVRMLIKDVLGLAPGSIVELERVAGEPVDLLVNGRPVAKGEVVVIDDNFGIRVTEIIGQVDRVAALARV